MIDWSLFFPQKITSFTLELKQWESLRKTWIKHLNLLNAFILNTIIVLLNFIEIRKPAIIHIFYIYKLQMPSTYLKKSAKF